MTIADTALSYQLPCRSVDLCLHPDRKLRPRNATFSLVLSNHLAQVISSLLDLYQSQTWRHFNYTLLGGLDGAWLAQHNQLRIRLISRLLQKV